MTTEWKIRFNFIPRKNANQKNTVGIDEQNQIFIWQKKRIVRKLGTQQHIFQYHCRLRHTTIQYTISSNREFWLQKYADTEGVVFCIR